jgi:hypothetical protein
MLVVVKYILLQTISLANLFENIHRLAEVCANSKRKRLPALYRLLVPKQTHLDLAPAFGRSGTNGGGHAEPRKARFFAEQKMRPNEVLKKFPLSVNVLQAEALYTAWVHG